MTLRAGLWVACGAVIYASHAIAVEGDAEAGEKSFRKCQACHQVGEDARHRTGPILNNVVGGVVAGQPGFKYSDALTALGDAETVWTPEALDAFLTKPRDFAKGTKMAFNGLKKPEERANVIAYLATYSDLEASTEEAFTVSDEILALEGDPEYGEYLSSECTTCHQTDGGDAGIPSIVQWPTDQFVTAMHAYREKERPNPVMQVITGRLGDEEIAALAAFFKDLKN